MGKLMKIIVIIIAILVLIASFLLNKKRFFGEFTLFMVVAIILIFYNFIALIIFSKKVDSEIKKDNLKIQQFYSEKPSEPQFSFANYRRCPLCGRVVHKDYNFCPYCGAKLK